LVTFERKINLFFVMPLIEHATGKIEWKRRRKKSWPFCPY